MYNNHIHKTSLNRQMYNPKDVSSKYTKSQKRWCLKNVQNSPHTPPLYVKDEAGLLWPWITKAHAKMDL